MGGTNATGEYVSVGNIRLRVLGGVALVLIVAALSLVPAAYAAGSAERANGGRGENVLGDVANAGNSTDPKQGGLPFTGLDLSFTVGGGLILLGSAVALSRILSRRSEA
jgi:hypothetical protein